jgi:uncharacterized membrane protein
VPPSGGTANSTLTIVVSFTSPGGNYFLNVTATYPSIVRWTVIELMVEFPISEWAISVSPNAQTISPGDSKTATVTAQSIGVFNSILTLNVDGIPPDVTVTFTPEAIQPPMGFTANSTMTINVGADARDGTYPLSITASNFTFYPSLYRVAPFTLTIGTEPVLDRVVVQNDSMWIDSAGILHVFGEVKNTGDVWLRYVKISGTLSGFPVSATVPAAPSPYLSTVPLTSYGVL